MRKLLFVTTVFISCVNMAIAQQKFELKINDGVTIVNGVSQPKDSKMVVCLPDSLCATGQVVMICPGGGYNRVVMDREGHEVAAWLNERGVAAVIVEYRLPQKGNHNQPIDDIHKAIEITRSYAAKWHIDSNKLGVMGFSAGGHLASTASTHFTPATRPNFSILVYPVITMGENTHSGSLLQLLGEKPSSKLVKYYSNEQQVTAQTPPTMLVHSHDDKIVPVVNSINYYKALKANGVAAEMHIFPYGGHGASFQKSKFYTDAFLPLLDRWLKELK